MKKKRPRKVRKRNPFAAALPRFKPQVVRSRVRYKRKPKHPKPPDEEGNGGDPQ